MCILWFPIDRTYVRSAPVPTTETELPIIRTNDVGSETDRQSVSQLSAIPSVYRQARGDGQLAAAGRVISGGCKPTPKLLVRSRNPFLGSVWPCLNGGRTRFAHATGDCFPVGVFFMGEDIFLTKTLAIFDSCLVLCY